MPRAGQGTWPVTDRETCVHMVQSGLDAGYRHVDTAQMYDNEAHAGESVTPGDETLAAYRADGAAYAEAYATDKPAAISGDWKSDS